MKKLIFLIGIILLMQFVGATALHETKLSDQGYVDMEVSGADEVACEEYLFSEDLNLSSKEFGKRYYLFSVHAEFFPVANEDAKIEVYLNDSNVVAAVGADEFREGWARINLPREILKEQNTVKICAITSHTTNRITVISDSIIGAYYLPDFSNEDAVVVSVLPTEPKLEQDFKVIVKLKNYGSTEADIVLRYRRGEFDDRTPYLTFVSGPASYEANIAECIERDSEGMCIVPSEIEFEYVIRSNRATYMTLLPAIVEYENDFGEIEQKESNRLKIQVVEQEIKIKPFISAVSESANTGEILDFRLGVKNDGAEPVYGIEISVFGDAGLEISGETDAEIAVLAPGDTEFIDLSAYSASSGEFIVGCEISYVDYNASTDCDAVKLIFEDTEIDPLWIIGALFAIAAIIIFLYINYRK